MPYEWELRAWVCAEVNQGRHTLAPGPAAARSDQLLTTKYLILRWRSRAASQQPIKTTVWDLLAPGPSAEVFARIAPHARPILFEASEDVCLADLKASRCFDDLLRHFVHLEQKARLVALGGVPCGFLGLVERDERHVDDVIVNDQVDWTEAHPDEAGKSVAVGCRGIRRRSKILTYARAGRQS